MLAGVSYAASAVARRKRSDARWCAAPGVRSGHASRHIARAG
jgi:hypothetical protein